MLAKIVTPNSQPAIRTATGAHNYRLLGVEITVAAGVGNIGTIVNIGTGGETSTNEFPSDIILDRVYVHGNANLDVRRCVAMNSIATAVIDSWLAECHSNAGDAQAILGWNGPGPLKIVNNHLEGSGENIMFGGADPRISGMVPADIEIRRNHFIKPLSWRGVWTVKNLLELKLGRRVLIDGNVFENSWASAQSGFAILIEAANQDGTAPWSVVEDITFTNNLVRHAAGGINLGSRDSGNPSDYTKRVKVANNVFEDIDAGNWGAGNGRLFQFIGTGTGPANITYEHNTGFSSTALIIADGAPQTNFVFRDNIADRAQTGIKGSGTGEGLGTLNQFMPGFVFTNNVIIGAAASLYPTGNFFPATVGDVAFENFANGDYRLAAGSQYLNAASDGTDPGADIVQLATAINGVIIP